MENNTTSVNCQLSTVNSNNSPFPPRQKNPALYNLTFDKIYILAALLAILATLITEVALGQMRYIYVVALSLAFVYFVVRRVVFSSTTFSQKVIGCAVGFSAVALSTLSFLTDPTVISLFVLPAIFVLALSSIALYIGIIQKNRPMHLINLAVAAVLCLVPFIINIASGFSAFVFSLFAFNGGMLACLWLLFSKNFYTELKAFFHL
jgi:hypothetical protein